MKMTGNSSNESNDKKTYISYSEEFGTVITTYGTENGTEVTYIPPSNPPKRDLNDVNVTDPDRPKDVDEW